MDEAEEGPWGQLVSITDVDTPPVPLVEDKFSIGRAKDCDISMANNKLVSGRHCHIERDEDGQVWLCDTSTNGTLLNVTCKITKGNRKELKHGDEFYVVYKKNDQDLNVGYLYQNMEALRKEMLDATQEYSSEHGMDATLLDDDVNFVEENSGEDKNDNTKKRCVEGEAMADEPPTKRLKSDSSSKSETKDIQEEITPKDTLPKSEAKEVQGEITPKETLPKSEAKEVKSEAKEVQGEITPEDKDTDSKTSAATKETCADGPDEIEEALICSICQELLHDCISLQPCMHSFCAGCYSDWMNKSNECPTCRNKVERINKNHIVNNLIEAYLKEHPDKKRDEEDLKELDAKNKISRDMLYPGAKSRHRASSSSSSSSDSDACPVNLPVSFTIAAPAPLLGFGTPVFGAIRPARTVCRQCADYKEPPGTTGGATATAGGATGTMGILGTIGNFGIQGTQPNTTGNTDTATPAGGGNNPTSEETADTEATLPSGDSVEPGPSGADPDVKVMPTPPDYKCSPQQTHVLCQCCLQPMPDRRMQYMGDPSSVPPQQCKICYRAYCHAYWGCKKVDCMGCLGKFQDINFGKKCLTSLILENQCESEIFKKYLEKNNLSVNYVLEQCLDKLGRGEFTCRDNARFTINGETPLCYPCALRNFKDLAYLFRFNIPKKDLPTEVTTRPDCHWGKHCRTQRHNINHGVRFNHICDQTRTS